MKGRRGCRTLPEMMNFFYSYQTQHHIIQLNLSLLCYLFVRKPNQMLTIGFDCNSLKYLTASFFATYCSGLTHPLDVIKTRLQSHDGRQGSDNLVPKYNSLKEAFSRIYNEEGLRGLFKGFYISLACQATAISLFFWIYEVRKRVYDGRGYQKMDSVTAASIEASIISTLITQPMWVIKTRMVLNCRKNVKEFQNFKVQTKEIHRQYGVKGFLKGLQLSLILSSTGVVQMYLYEGAKTLYQSLEIPESQLEEKHFICGGISKVLSVLWSYPLTTIRTRIQQNQYINDHLKQKYVGSIDILKRILREEGVRGFFKGISANVMRGVGQKGIYFYCYELFKNFMNKGREKRQ